ncbi:MAG: carboxymuconolactone decarboxylase family protein [Alphaproteobacteria bacterium]|nr:carboxymuconolactone decarboxylase family protein [Alphaproteobacteria bacterium]
MPLIAYADIERLPPKVREAFDRLPRKLNIFRLWANAPACFRQGLRLGGAILGQQELSAQLRELIILLTAHEDGGAYEWHQHVPIALALGCTQEQIDALARNAYEAACFDEKTRILLRLASEVRTSVRAREETVRAAQTVASAQELVEVIITVGFYMTMARLTETARVELDAPGGTAVLEALTKES